MQREEKQLEAALEAIILRVNDLKNSLASMLFKVENEYETMNWPSFLDNYAVLSGHVSIMNSLVASFIKTSCIHFQLTSLSKTLSHDKSPLLRNLTVLPLLLSPERDDNLAQQTEGRVTTFAHDLVPDYLRTKLEPMAETKMLQLEHKAASLSYETATVNIIENQIK